MKIEDMIFANRADCSGCETCSNVCPRNAIQMRRDAEGFAYPAVNRELCIGCGKCDAVCPALNFKKKSADILPKVFAAINRDEKIRRHSSSGGVFSALSELVLRGGGVVFGATFDENFHVKHAAAKSLDELERLRGSKYVQSQIGDVYRQVKAALESKQVLFSGTPCQCAGLKNFLGGDNENLLTVEIICHGTPSPMLWENYIGELGYAHEVRHVNFRSKRNGWTNLHFEVHFADQGYYLRSANQDTYEKIFLRNLTLRLSCHTCKFRFPNGMSDLTIGDAWGIQTFAPDMFDNRGTSVVFVHTAKGKEFFERANMLTRPVKFFDAATHNPNFIMPSIADPRRENFFENIKKFPDKFAVMQYYAQQDDSQIRKHVAEQRYNALIKIQREIAAQVRKNFERNVLVFATMRDNREQKFLGDYFTQRIPPNVGVYLMRSLGNGQFACTENFSSLTFTLKGELDVLNIFIKQFKVATIFIEQSLKIEPSVIDWLKNCGLPVKIFSRS